MQFVDDMLSRRGTDPAKAIGAGRCHRPSKSADYLRKDRMRTHAHSHGVETGRHDIRDERLAGQHEGKWPGPEPAGQLLDQLTVPFRDASRAIQPIARRQMDDERIEVRALLDGEDACGCLRFERVSRESVNGFCRQSHRLAGSQ